MPARKKPDSERQRRNKPGTADIRLVDDAAFAIKPLPAKGANAFLKSTRDWWDDFWRQRELLLGLGTIDVHVVRRLAEVMDLRERARRSVKRSPLVEGSQGQPVENPLAKAMSRYDAEIRAIEDRLGLSPKARLSIGITFGQAKRSIEDLLRPTQIDQEDNGDDEDEAPPNVIEI